MTAFVFMCSQLACKSSTSPSGPELVLLPLSSCEACCCPLSAVAALVDCCMLCLTAGQCLACRMLHRFRLLQVTVVPDEVAAISAEVHAASEASEVVITSGGLGPTPDDVTMAAVAKALGYPLTRSAPPACAHRQPCRRTHDGQDRAYRCQTGKLTICLFVGPSI